MSTDKKGKTVLIVDDDKPTVDFIANHLHREGIKVEVAYDGKAGVEAYIKAPTDWIFLDIKMPVLNGIDALKQIKAFHKEANILMITGDQKDFETMAKTLGALDYIKKPVDLIDLDEKIRKYVYGLDL